MKQAGQLCNESAKAAYVEVSSRLQVRAVLAGACYGIPYLLTPTCLAKAFTLPPSGVEDGHACNICRLHLSACFAAAAQLVQVCRSWFRLL